MLRRPWVRRTLIALAAVVAAIPVAITTLFVYFWVLSTRFPGPPYDQPSRLYSRVTKIEVGRAMSPESLVEALEARDYRRFEGEGEIRPGTFRQLEGGRLAIHFRAFPTPDGLVEPERVEVVLNGGKVVALKSSAGDVTELPLEPVLLASYYTPDVEERRPVRLEEVPEHVVRAILAAEDEGYYRHLGLSISGIVRALWVNFQTGEVRQGGSTITQQLVKNLYLTHERSLDRKAREAVLAILLEQRYSKDRILEVYLNEIYWGGSGSVNLMGLGAAAHAYFGKHPSELTLAEAATLAGMIQAPADYSPTTKPDQTLERRDWVLGRLRELEWLPREQIAQALEEPLKPDPRPVVARRAGHFAESVREEAEERFDLDELGGAGYLLFSTLDWDLQRTAEAVVKDSLVRFDGGWEKGRHRGQQLEAALISAEPESGEILAYVGGRSFEDSQFDRVSQARRQVGSAFKPIVYAAAFAEGGINPASPLRDSPVLVRWSTTEWRPQNHSRSYQGVVTARAALERSLNIPAVRVGIGVGVDRVARLARDMGVTTRLKEVPSLVLGAVALSPREVATVYATLANLGARPTLHGLAAVLEPDGSAVKADPPPPTERVLDAQSAYLVTSVLQGVLERGTGAGARQLGVRDPLAGKTGTSNDRRDSWFAGYSPDRVTVVWVGYDDNLATRLSGARAALPIWARFTAATRPPGGYAPFERPPGLMRAVVDPQTGELATEWCPYRREEVFAPGNRPVRYCHLHRYQFDEAQILADPYFLGDWQPGEMENGEVELNGYEDGLAEGEEAPGEGISFEPPEPSQRPLPKLKVRRPEAPPKEDEEPVAEPEPAEPPKVPELPELMRPEEEPPAEEGETEEDDQEDDIPPVFTRRAFNAARYSSTPRKRSVQILPPG